VANAVVNLLDDTLGADGIDLASFNDLEAAVAIVIIIGKA
jgi:hypothetical protein